MDKKAATRTKKQKEFAHNIGFIQRQTTSIKQIDQIVELVGATQLCAHCERVRDDVSHIVVVLLEHQVGLVELALERTRYSCAYMCMLDFWSRYVLGNAIRS